MSCGPWWLSGAVYRLLRTLSIDRGLVKDTRVVIIALGCRLITVRVLTPSTGRPHASTDTSYPHADDILLPRISFTTTLRSGHTLLRQQFALAPAYATTFNGCQGLTLDTVGIDLIRPVFSHGQLYTALSRIRHRSHARIRWQPGDSTVLNVTYPEILLD
ncbi:hypothetical protein C8Q76DRAFT_771721 [Earliella scabrosa]|nr:hypothetical protein C8Q76DRAFT_771721 [Earliella scabrosa]